MTPEEKIKFYEEQIKLLLKEAAEERKEFGKNNAELRNYIKNLEDNLKRILKGQPTVIIE